MDAIFMNSENSKISEPHVLILKLTDNLDLTLFRMGFLGTAYGWGGLAIPKIRHTYPTKPS